MGWNTIIVSEKGILAGKYFVSGDITGNITFANYTDNVNTIPTVSQDDENHRIQEYIGWSPDNSFNWIVANLDTTHKLVAAFRLTAVDPLNINAGTFLCLKMWARDIQNTESRKSAFIGCEWCKRVYTDNIHYTESYPLGNYWPDGEYNFTPSTEFPGRSAETLALFLKTGFFNIEKNVVGGMAIGWHNGYASCYGSGNAFRAKYSWFNSASGFGTDAEVPEGEEYSPEYGKASEPDGYGNGGAIGNHDKHSDHTGIPAKPQYGFTSAGFLNHYKISSMGLEMLGEALFPEPVLASTSVQEAVDKLIANQWNSKVLDYVVDCRVIPVEPSAPNLQNISCGGKVLVNPSTHNPYAAYLITEDFVDVDCGTINTPLVEGNFLDFYGLHCKLFLPFYGFVDIDPEYWMGATIGVYYRFNCMDGSFMCWVTSKAFRSDMDVDDVIGQYSGNACIHLPISSQNYAQVVNGLITTGASIVGVAATGDVLGTAISAASGAEKVANSRPTLNKSNSYSGSSAMMSKRTPYLLIEFNEAQFSTKYVDEQGLPAVVTKTLGECEGFTIATNPILDGIPCTEAEKERIRSALASGLIFKNPVTPP